MISSYTISARWWITLTVVLVAMVEVLDMTIVNVSLPNMMGALGANSEQISWVLTSYIVSSAICMPLTGLLVNRLGQKRLLLINIIGFLVTSMLCGFSGSLWEIVLFRVLQGIFGASLVPLSQLFLRDIFPKEEVGTAMAIWGVGVMVAPVFGPTLGGYITEALNWRWVFFINIPICLFSFLLASMLLQDTKIKKIKIDWIGLFWMSLGIACLQIFLDRGNQEDWFDSSVISLLFITWVAALFIFIFQGVKKADNIINLNLFKDKNFLLGCLVMTLYSAGIFGVLAAQPLLTEAFMGFPTTATGLIMAPRGIASALAMAVAGLLMKKMDPRKIIFSGLFFSALGSWMMSRFTLDASISYMSWAGAVQGFGMGLVFVPLSVMIFATLQTNNVPEAAGLFSFGRSLGSSIGISVLSTMITRGQQINWNVLVRHLSIYNTNLQGWLQKMGWKITDPIALQTLANTLMGQATILSFNKAFLMTAWFFLLLLPIICMMDQPRTIKGIGEGAH